MTIYRGLTSGLLKRILTAVRWVEARAGGSDPAAAPQSQILPPPPYRYGTLDGDLVAAGEATVSIWTQTGGTWSDTTVNQEHVHAPPLLRSGKMAEGKWVRVEWYMHGQYYEASAVECPME